MMSQPNEMKQLFVENTWVVDGWAPCGEDCGHASVAEGQEHQPTQLSKGPGSEAWGLCQKHPPEVKLFSFYSPPRENELQGKMAEHRWKLANDCRQPQKPMLRVMFKHKVGWWIPGAPRAALLLPLGTCSVWVKWNTSWPPALCSPGIIQLCVRGFCICRFH